MRSLLFTSPGKVNKTISKDKAKYVVKLNVEESDPDFRSFILKCNETLDKLAVVTTIATTLCNIHMILNVSLDE